MQDSVIHSSVLAKAVVCKRCSGGSQKEFNAEINVHFPGWEGLEKPTVWVFPKILVCLDCGFAEFSVPKTELLRLAEDAA